MYEQQKAKFFVKKTDSSTAFSKKKKYNKSVVR